MTSSEKLFCYASKILAVIIHLLQKNFPKQNEIIAVSGRFDDFQTRPNNISHRNITFYKLFLVDINAFLYYNVIKYRKNALLHFILKGKTYNDHLKHDRREI